MYNINTFPEKVLIWNSERFLTFFEADLRMCNIAKQAEVSGHTGYFNCYMHSIVPQFSPQQCQCCIFLRNWQHSRSTIGRFRLKLLLRLAADGII